MNTKLHKNARTTPRRARRDRCQHRARLCARKPLRCDRGRRPQKPHKALKADEPGCLQMAEETRRSCPFVAIDRATRWVFVQTKSDKTARSASGFLTALHKACPINIQELLTDNDKEFTDRLFATPKRAPRGAHGFDRPCCAFGLEHRPTTPRPEDQPLQLR